MSKTKFVLIDGNWINVALIESVDDVVDRNGDPNTRITLASGQTYYIDEPIDMIMGEIQEVQED